METKEESGANKRTDNSQLEQFVLLAKNTSGKATVAVLNQAFRHKSVFVFAELRELQCVQNLKGTENESYLNVLDLFSYGTYKDYLESKASLPSLNDPALLNKLKQLSIVSFASRSKVLEYEELLEQLEIQGKLPL